MFVFTVEGRKAVLEDVCASTGLVQHSVLTASDQMSSLSQLLSFITASAEGFCGPEVLVHGTGVDGLSEPCGLRWRSSSESMLAIIGGMVHGVGM